MPGARGAGGWLRRQREGFENERRGGGLETVCRHEPEQRKLIKRGDETLLDIWGGGSNHR